MASHVIPRVAVLFLFLCLGLVVGCTMGTGKIAAPTASPASDVSTAPVGTAVSPDASDQLAATCDCPCATASTVAYPGVGSPQVTLHGAFFGRATDELDIRRGKGLVVPAATVADGAFLERFQQWDEGAVWWEVIPGTPADSRPWIEIDLGGTFRLDTAIVQADNNDTYLLSYRDPGSGEWKQLWEVPEDLSFGMVTRPNQYDNTERWSITDAVTTDAVRIDAGTGDHMYAIAEVQLFGTPAD